MSSKAKSVPWIFWPFVALWRFVTGILEFTGRMVAILLGFVLIAAGILISLTVIGAIIGVPMAVFGFLLLLRGIF